MRLHQRKVHSTEIEETPQNEPPGPPVPENDLPDLPESDLGIPDDPILDFVNSQFHSAEDLDQDLQAYQVYQVPCPQHSTMTPERSINHHFTNHIAQASQAKHGSLVDRGANGGLAGSDVRILSRSSRKCTVTGIDSHELQGLDVVQGAALVETNHGIVTLILNEYACYGKVHTIHSSGQIEWFKNSVDERSVQVGEKQRICTIDGYSMPLTCRGGLMYLSILGKPTDKDLERYPSVHLTRPHGWDPSVLDYTHPSGDGEPPWSNDPDERSAFDPNFDEFGDYTQRAIQTLSILDDSSSTLTPCPTFMANQHEFKTYQHDFKHEAPDYEKFRPYFGWVNVDTVQKSKHQTPSESQTALNNFKKGTKRDASVYPIFKNDKYYDTFQRSFLANLKAQGLYDVADPDHDPENGDTYEKELFKGQQSFVYSVLVTSLQTEKGRKLVKEFEGDARSIILKLHHYHT